MVTTFTLEQVLNILGSGSLTIFAIHLYITLKRQGSPFHLVIPIVFVGLGLALDYLADLLSVSLGYTMYLHVVIVWIVIAGCMLCYWRKKYHNPRALFEGCGFLVVTLLVFAGAVIGF
jgi:hypothetical protein